MIPLQLLVQVIALVIIWMGAESPDPRPSIDDVPIVYLGPADVECFGPSRCADAADRAFRRGVALMNDVDADPANPYLASKELTRARLLLANEDLPIPAEMQSISDRQERLNADLSRIYRDHLWSFKLHSDRKMYGLMASDLQSLRVHIPDAGARYHLWALDQEMTMKAHGTYPHPH